MPDYQHTLVLQVIISFRRDNYSFFLTLTFDWKTLVDHIKQQYEKWNITSTEKDFNTSEDYYQFYVTR